MCLGLVVIEIVGLYNWFTTCLFEYFSLWLVMCMITTYMLTIEQVQTLQPMDASLSRATYDDDVLSKSS